MEWNGARRARDDRNSRPPSGGLRLGARRAGGIRGALPRGGPGGGGARDSRGGAGAGRAWPCRCEHRGCWASCEVQSRSWGRTASCCRAPGPGASAWWAAGTSSSPSPSPGTESKVWSPLVNEEGKTHPYKMNLASQPQQRPTQFPRAFSMTCQPAGLTSCPLPMSPMQAPVASIYNPLQVQTSERRHSTSSIPSQVRVGPEQLKRTAQICPKSPVEVEVPGLKVLHVQFNSPLQLYSQSNIMDSLKGQISSVSPDFPSLDQHNQPPGSIVIDRESEVYKMLQENQESNEPPRQSASFLVLQEILESEEKGDPTKPSGFRSVKAPTTKVAASIGNAQKLPMCDKCGSGIVGVFVKIRDKQRHPECYVCSDCGTNLKQKGHFFVEDQIYCEKHARERVIPPEGYEVVTVFPK
ncbi:PDZ and LIM domain protein 1 isoform X4 [Lathamus discolor]|uniref:PDZ and LIM domain protein 1 isoform X4 n=1 Tax=Lathamus discolor TaxID=678569 RepID=UPI0032B79930